MPRRAARAPRGPTRGDEAPGPQPRPQEGAGRGAGRRLHLHRVDFDAMVRKGI